MSSKTIERRIMLRDQVTPTMSKINKSTINYKKNVKDLKRSGDKTWRSLKRNMVGVAMAGAALAKSVLAIRGMEEKYIIQSQALAKLEAVFRATGRATDEEVLSLKKYSSELQGLGVIGDEVIHSGMQQLATFNVTADTVKTLSEGMMDLVAQTKGLDATGQDAVNIANMIGKAMGGQIGALSRVGISFTEAQGKVLKYGTESEKAATMAEVLRQNVGGVNAALAATDEGQIKQLKNRFGDLQETVGSVMVNIKASFASAFNENMPAIEARVNAVADSLNRWVDEGGITRFIETVGIVKQTLVDLSPIIGAVATAIGIYKINALYATLTQQGLNAAMMANPIGFVIGLLVGLVTVITIVRKNKETLKIKFMTTWNAIAGYAEGAINRMIGGLNTMLSGVSYFKDNVVYFFENMWNIVVSMAERRAQDFLKPMNAMLRAMGKEEIKVNFSAVKRESSKPVYEKRNFIDEIEVKRFSNDTISAIEEARRRKQEKQIEDNTKAMAALSDDLSENTSELTKNTEALKKSSKDLTGEEIADKLLPRLERVVYG